MDVHYIRIRLIKTLLGKTIWDKNLVKEKEYNILLNMQLQPYQENPVGKTMVKENIMHINFPSWQHQSRSLSWRTPILRTSFSNIAVGAHQWINLLNFSLERICWTLITLFFWRSCVKKNFGEICFILSPLMYHSFYWVIHTILYSYMIVGIISLKDKLHVW